MFTMEPKWVRRGIRAGLGPLDYIDRHGKQTLIEHSISSTLCIFHERLIYLVVRSADNNADSVKCARILLDAHDIVNSSYGFQPLWEHCYKHQSLAMIALLGDYGHDFNIPNHECMNLQEGT